MNPYIESVDGPHQLFQCMGYTNLEVLQLNKLIWAGEWIANVYVNDTYFTIPIYLEVSQVSLLRENLNYLPFGCLS